MKSLATTSNDAFKLNIDTQKGLSTFRVMQEEAEISSTDDGFWKLLGIDVKRDWLRQGVYLGKANFF